MFRDRQTDVCYILGHRYSTGTILDGETIVFSNGKPDFALLESREHSRRPMKIRSLARSIPATFIAFDVLYWRYQSVMAEPFIDRRKRLQEIVATASQPALILSEGIRTHGKAMFADACARGLEGVVAKRLKSTYLPGKRTDAWIEIKRSETLACAIIGFVLDGKSDFRSLILATVDNGTLRYVGRVGTGFSRQLRSRINTLLWSRLRDSSVVPCRIRAMWVEPLFCTVRCLERTPAGQMRAPVFLELMGE